MCDDARRIKKKQKKVSKRKRRLALLCTVFLSAVCLVSYGKIAGFDNSSSDNKVKVVYKEEIPPQTTGGDLVDDREITYVISANKVIECMVNENDHSDIIGKELSMFGVVEALGEDYVILGGFSPDLENKVLIKYVFDNKGAEELRRIEAKEDKVIVVKGEVIRADNGILIAKLNKAKSYVNF